MGEEINFNSILGQYISFVGSGINFFEGTKKYVATGSLINKEIVDTVDITYDSRPSRANMEFKIDDVICAKMKNTDKILLIDNYAKEFIFSTGFVGLRVNNLNKLIPKYVFYWLNSYYFQEMKNNLCNGTTQEAITIENLKKIPIRVPPIDNQKSIINFLDRKTAKIDFNMAKNKELISLLEEKKIALINHVVTKGLDSNAPMKDSGIEWIGEMPKHWNIFKLKFFGEVIGGYAFKSSDFVDDGVKVVKITNVQSFNFNWSECFYLPKHFLNEYPEFKINKGDVVFALTRPIISTGIKAAIYNETEISLANQRTGIFKKCNENLISDFLYYLIYSDYFKEDFKSKITATNQPNISPIDINNIKILVPSIEEQRVISNFLKENILKIDNMIEKIQENIGLLEEYKTSLIYHVVTGKIDVRDEV